MQPKKTYQSRGKLAGAVALLMFLSILLWPRVPLLASTHVSETDVERFLVETAFLSLERPDRAGVVPTLFLEVYIERQARREGLELTAYADAVKRWTEQARRGRDAWHRGLAAFAEGDFEQAAKRLDAVVADREARAIKLRRRGKEVQASEARRELIEARRVLTATLFILLRTDAAMLSAERAIVDSSGLDVAVSAAVRRDAAAALVELAVIAEDKDAREDHLQAAFRMLQDALDFLERDTHRELWASVQFFLGRGLVELAQERPERAAARLYEDGLFAFDAAIEERPRDEEPELWALLQFHRSKPLSQLGALRDPGGRRLSSAIQALRDALGIWTPERTSELWTSARNNLAGLVGSVGLQDSSPGGAALLAEAIDIFRDLLERQDAEADLGQVSLLAGNLAWHLIQRGHREGDYGVRHYAEAAEVYREILPRLKKQHDPLDWARKHHFLGIALREQARRRDDIEGSESAVGREALLKEAEGAFKTAAEVYAQEEKDSVLASLEALAQTLELAGRPDDAAKVLQEVLERDAGYRDGVLRYRLLLQNSLAEREKALRLTESWLRRHPGDLLVAIYLVESLFNAGRFEDCVRQARILTQDARVLPAEQVVVRVYEVAALRLLEAPAEEIGARIGDLIAGLEKLPEGFVSGWSFPGTAGFIESSQSAASHRGWLLELFAVIEEKDRVEVVQALRRLLVDLGSQAA